MRAISRGLSRFCYNHPNLGIPDLIKYIALGNVFVYIADMPVSYTHLPRTMW